MECGQPPDSDGTIVKKSNTTQLEAPEVKNQTERSTLSRDSWNEPELHPVPCVRACQKCWDWDVPKAAALDRLRQQPQLDISATSMSISVEVHPSGCTLYVLIPPSPLFAAHWSFFIPDASSFDTASKRLEEPRTGRRIHVSGDRLNGFNLEIVRGYDLTKHRSVRRFPIAIVASVGLESQSPSSQNEDSSIFPQKDEDEGGGYIDNHPIDGFERACVETPAPGPSLNRVSDSAGGSGKRMKAEVRDCQWWVRQVVGAMYGSGILSALPSDPGDAGKSPSQLVATLPVH